MGVFKKDENWFIDYYANGRRIRERIGPSKTLAETVLKKRKVEIAENRFLDIKKEEKVTFEEFAEIFVNLHSKPNKKSWESDVYNLKGLAPFFKGKYLYQITAEDIEKFKAERSKGVKPATVNRELATLKTMFNKAVVWGRIKESPAKNVAFLREPNGRLRYLELEEIARFLSNCSERLKPIVLVALNTGMRRGEIFGLKWHDIDFQRGIIHLFNTKNGEKREVRMNDLVKKALIAVRKHPDSPYIFCDRDGKPCHDIRKSFYTALKKSGIMNFRFHDLRHTFASQLAMSGVDINTIRELLGHRDMRMTLRYAHLSPDHKKRAIDILGNRMDTFWTPKAYTTNYEDFDVSQLLDNELVTPVGA